MKKQHAGVRRKGQHLTEQDRYDIERLLKKGWSKKKIAEALDCCRATVYNELKRGQYTHLVESGAKMKEEVRYAPDLSWGKYINMLKKKGSVPKLMQDPQLVEYLKVLILEKKYSPATALMQIEEEKSEFKVRIKSVNTIYAGIKRGYIKGVSLIDLPDCGYHRMKETKEKMKEKKKHKNKLKGESIENRSPEVEKRLDFGHWEMDTVKGKKSNKKCLLVLTERKTRYEIVELLKAGTTEEVRKALNRIEKRFGSMFFSIFQTITVDNGAEFKDCDSMQKALYRVGNRTKIYYCHPYSASERGSNEVQNRLLRRFHPKGSDFDSTLSRANVRTTEAWINEMPRKQFDGKAALHLFQAELLTIKNKADP